MKIKFILVLVFSITFGFAQNHKGTIENIKEDGFHKILIDSKVRSASHDNLDYFRILDKNKNEVSYVVFDDINQYFLRFKELKILSKTILKDSLTSIVVPYYNPMQKNSTELGLHITNTTINKTYSISGSNDQKEWFGLVANQTLTDINDKSGKIAEKIVSFPDNNFKFLKIEFNDKNSLPINVLDIGFFKGDEKVILSSILNDFTYKISENKKDKKTIITFSADNFQKVDGISFAIATKLFSRNTRLFVKRTRKIKKRTENYQEEISGFVLNSNTSNSFQLNGFFEKEFTLEIENQDNQPLEFSKIELLQNSLYVISDLKSNEKYEVSIDSTLSKPQYDLANFILNAKDYPKAMISNFKKIENQKTNTFEKPFWQTKAFMWICILFGIAIIGYFAMGLLKDMKKE
ncbi:hypothetical protein FLGE108171_13570 [Flavobacterium gelidilacus]|uniref:hypothetical protein n=1 Tax=Flavobacterium gelidilacus TaxID=206041 RepID=UPI0003F940E1|nr:hypothetical protein [Flavobacterium gelidilacus]